MKNLSILFVLPLLILSLCAVKIYAAEPSFTVLNSDLGSCSENEATHQILPTTVSATLQNTGDTINGDIMQLRVYDNDHKVVLFHQDFWNSIFPTGGTSIYQTQWTPPGPGDYVLQLGMVDTNKNILYLNSHENEAFMNHCYPATL